ncbi:unnamed protein product [Schistosoma guineensis]|nr:unnamed protein product [Schistosoma bovis]CAH8464341.1 unnamed protein product [Schistosoma guineensis]
MEEKVRSPPVDRYNLAYVFLFLHGIGFLIPWNVFINGYEYFDYKLNTTTSYNADYRINLLSYFGFAAQFPSLCFAAWNTFYQSGSTTSTPRFRFLGCMIVEIIVLVLTIILALIDTSSIPGTFFLITIICVVIINSCVGVHQTLTFGIAALLPMKYSNAVIVGSNACGAIISLVNIITKSLTLSAVKSQRSIIISAVIFFLSAVLIIIACTFTFFWLQRLKFVRYYSKLRQCDNHINESERSHNTIQNHINTNNNNSDNNNERKIPALLTLPKDSEESQQILDRYSPQISKSEFDENDWDVEQPAEKLLNSSSNKEPSIPSTMATTNTHITDQLVTGKVNDGNKEHLVKKYRSVQTSGWYIFRNCFGLCCFKPPSGKQRCLDYWSKYSLTMKECWSQCANIWCVFSCTLSIFPAVQSRVRPVNPEYFIPPLWFVDVTCFLFFNVFAMLGCILCNWIQFPGPRYLWIPVLLRTIIFIPFFLSCNFGIENPHLSVLITNDHIYVLGCILFAFSNGHLASLGLMYAPRCCSPDRAPLAGMFAAFFLILGVFTGVYASRGLNSLIY